MTRNPIVPTALCLLVALVAAGCGDASADETSASQCQRLCEYADSCPRVFAVDDCVSNCEDAVEEAAALGGTCPGSLDDFISCQQQLSCSDLADRARGGFYDDACVPREEALRECVPGDAPSLGGGNPDEVGELALACQSLCDAYDDCPTIVPEPDCLSICVDGLLEPQNGEAVCADAVVDMVNCRAAMSCRELDSFARDPDIEDRCTDSVRRAARLCI